MSAGSETVSRPLITFAALSATLMQTLDTTIANVALPHMQGSLSAGQDQVSWILTSYIVASAIATAPTGYLTRLLGLKKVFLVAVTGFTISSMLCGVAGNLEEMVLFRLMQGLFGASLVPLSQATLLDYYPREQQGSAMAAWGMGVMVGPIIGPALGGWLTENYSWRWVFFINVPVGIATLFALVGGLPKLRSQLAAGRMDFFGFGLLSVSIGALQLMLDRGQSKGWFGSSEIIIEASVAAIAFYLFVAHTITAKKPFLPRELFRDRNMVGGLVVITVIGVVLFSTFALLPPFLQNLRGFPVIAAGLLMAPRGMGTMIAMRLAGKMVSRTDPRRLIFFGMVCMVVSLYWMSKFSLDVPQWQIIWSGVVQGAGLGFVFVPLSAVTFSTIDPALRADATSMFSLLRNVGSSVGIALAFAYQDFGTKFAHAVMTEKVNFYNPAIAGYVNGHTGILGAEGLAGLSSELERQAAMIGMLGVFHYMAIGVVVVLPLLLLLKPVPHPPMTRAEEEAEEVLALE